jgi:hypothetical protein
MLIATAEVGAPGRTAAPADDVVRAALRRVSDKLRHAAEVADDASGGSAPEWGGDIVLAVLDSLAPELAVLTAARDAADPL